MLSLSKNMGRSYAMFGPSRRSVGNTIVCPSIELPGGGGGIRLVRRLRQRLVCSPNQGAIRRSQAVISSFCTHAGALARCNKPHARIVISGRSAMVFRHTFSRLFVSQWNNVTWRQGPPLPAVVSGWFVRRWSANRVGLPPSYVSSPSLGPTRLPVGCSRVVLSSLGTFTVTVCPSV